MLGMEAAGIGGRRKVLRLCGYVHDRRCGSCRCRELSIRVFAWVVRRVLGVVLTASYQLLRYCIFDSEDVRFCYTQG